MDSHIFQVSKLAVPFIFIATHFMNLTKLKDHHFNIVNLHLAAEETIKDGISSLKYIHKVRVIRNLIYIFIDIKYELFSGGSHSSVRLWSNIGKMSSIS